MIRSRISLHAQSMEGGKEGYVYAIKEHVAFFFRGTFKDFEIFEDLGSDFHGIEIANTIFAEEIKRDFVRWFQSNMFESKGTTTHCIGFILTFLIPRSKSKSINEVHRRSPLSRLGHLILQIASIIRSDRINMILSSTKYPFRVGP